MSSETSPDLSQLVIATHFFDDYSESNLTMLCCQISGELIAAQTSLCSRHSTEDQPPLSLPPAKLTRLALVFRGGCKFATKAENAGRAGWGGLVILDNQNNTRVSKISGLRSALTENMTVIFLLKTEADILLRLMSGSDKRNVSITGGIITGLGW